MREKGGERRGRGEMKMMRGILRERVEIEIEIGIEKGVGGGAGAIRLLEFPVIETRITARRTGDQVEVRVIDQWIMSS